MMSIALPGSHNMFGRLQNALFKGSKTRIDLSKGVHQALDNFRWIAKDLTSRLTHLAKLSPLAPVAKGHRDASGKGTGGVLFPGDELQLQNAYQAGVPLPRRLEWPGFVTRCLMTDKNPGGTITNSDLELAGGFIHLDAIAQMFDMCGRTVLSKGITSTPCSGSARATPPMTCHRPTSSSCPACTKASQTTWPTRCPKIFS